MTTLIAEPPKPQAKAYIAWPPLIWIASVHMGALLAFWPGYFTWGALAACVVGHWITGGLGICMTYHRLLTHRSFSVRPKWLEYPLTMIGCAASEGGAIGWVADHRRHHAHSDEEGDVHSPNQGFGWAHMFWWMTPDITSRHTPEYLKKWAPDLYRDPVHRVLNDWNVIFSILTGVLMYAIGGMPWLVWGYFVRTILVLHTTWLVNSATHVWGYRSHDTRDNSTNNWWVAALTYGEGLAQQSPRLPDLGPPRSGLVGDRPDLPGHQGALVRRDHLQHPPAEARQGRPPRLQGLRQGRAQVQEEEAAEARRGARSRQREYLTPILAETEGDGHAGAPRESVPFGFRHLNGYPESKMPDAQWFML